MAANPQAGHTASPEELALQCYHASKGAVVLLGPKSKRPLELPNGRCKKWKGVLVTLEDLRIHVRNGGNFGIKTGTPSGLDICDIDAPEEYLELVERLKALTPYTQTGGGGFHFWFEHHPRVRKNRTAALPGIDIKTTDGYAVAPGSVHDETGVVYELFGRLEDAVQWPQDLLDMLFPDSPGTSCAGSLPTPPPPGFLTPYVAKALESAIDNVQAAPVGIRNDTLNRESFGLGGLAHLGLDRTDVEPALIQSAVTAGLSETEARATFNSGWENGLNSPRSVEVSRQNHTAPEENGTTRRAQERTCVPIESPIPLELTEDAWPDPNPAGVVMHVVPEVEPEMLPPCIGDWVLDAADRMQTAPDYMAVSACVMMGNLIGRQLVIRPKHHDNWSIYPNLWGCLVGNSSMMKTPAITETRKILDIIDQENIAAHNTALDEWRPQARLFEAKKKAAMKKAEHPSTSDEVRQNVIDSIPEPPPMPELKRIYTNSCTIQKLTVILKGSPNGILVLRDELAGWVNSFEKKGHEDDRPFYLEGWSGNGRYWEDTIYRGSNVVDGLCIGVLGGATPGGMSNIVKEALGNKQGADGLLQRFSMIAYPARLDKFVWTDRSPDENAFRAAEAAFRRCAAVDLTRIKAERLLYPGSIPFLRFDSNAQELFKEWHTDLQQRLLHSDDHDALLSHIKKFNEMVCGLALTFHVATDGTGPVTETSLLRAIRWAEYAEAHARKLYSQGGPAGTLLSHIERGDLKNNFTERDVREKGWSGLTVDETVGNALDKLVENGYIRAVEKKGLGRPTTTYLLHPKYRRNDQ